ncbi:MAG: hypothetical protein GTO53_00715, partial [Planctomycetales bacterium]|nr:hypothetical protein [Planctomycetales bacterium]NIM07702.1 hypothetical protein [Planctomycetales bacterium]NIN76299.1 hypothetical protein [Planctomycetales bacterium]NIO33504.1 hypothetical protein [Planctomycetales bacterium]NIO45323.1 hypothetical protein [Planctomycetales bacterium]
PADPAAAQPPGPAPNRSKYVLADEPAGAQGVRQVRQAAKDQDEVIVVGRIGGLANPWVEGRAAFSIVDPALKSCHDMGDDDCPTPWDYC